MPDNRPLDLSGYIDSSVAPFDWVAQHGRGMPHDYPMLCPICSTAEVSIRIGATFGDSHILFFPEGKGNVAVQARDGIARIDDPQGVGLSVSIPMHCAAGHRWLLDIGHDASARQPFEGYCRFGVLLDEELYETH